MVEVVQQGGVILWVIVACGLVALGVFMERLLHLHRARIKSEDFIAGICNNLRRGNLREALVICDETPGPVAEIVRAAILNREGGKEAIRMAVENAGRTEISRMERRLAALATMAQVAPLLGLLGTVLGMIQSLRVMRAAAPLVQPGDVMGGLMQALAVTAAGLAVAAPCYVAFNFLLGKVEKIVLDMERAASDIIAFLGGAPLVRDDEPAGKGGE
jgi:biopolymer transport protein ExbB